MYLKSVDCSKYIATINMRVLWRLSIPSSADIKRGDGTVYTSKDYGDKVFETILRRQTFSAMIIVVNDYYGNDAVNGKGRERQKSSAAYVGDQTKNVLLQRKDIFKV